MPGGGNAAAGAGTPLTPVCYSTDQVKGVLTLQGDALSQAVSYVSTTTPGAPFHSRPAGDEDGLLALPPASCMLRAGNLSSLELFPCMSVL